MRLFHPETSPTNLLWHAMIIFSLLKCIVERKMHTLNRGQTTEGKLSQSWWVALVNQRSNEQLLLPFQATLEISKATTIKKFCICFFQFLENMTVFLSTLSNYPYCFSCYFVVSPTVVRFWYDIYFDLEYPFFYHLNINLLAKMQ